MTAKISFTALITKHLNVLADVCEKHNPDGNHNTGRGLGVVYFWSMIEKYAEAKKKEAWENLAKDNVVADDLKDYDPGEYTLADSPSFHASAKVSNPVNRFNADELATQLKNKYKVPVPIAKEMIDKAKIPSSSTVTKSVVER